MVTWHLVLNYVPAHARTHMNVCDSILLLLVVLDFPPSLGFVCVCVCVCLLYLVL